MDSQNRAERGATAAKAPEQVTFAQKFSEFLRARRVVLLVIGAAILVAVAGLAVWSALRNAALEASSIRMEALAEDFLAWSAEADQPKKAELEKKLLSGVDEILGRWPSLFAAQRALALRARLAEERKDWNAAGQDWDAIATRFPKSYLAPLALQNAAVAAEERGAPEEAAKRYQSFLERFEGKAPGSAHAYFALGRLAEDSKDWSGALGRYEKLAAAYPDDDWTKLAKDRILSIKSRGLAK